MQIELDLNDELLAQALAFAERKGTTLDALVNEGLTHVLAEDLANAPLSPPTS